MKKKDSEEKMTLEDAIVTLRNMQKRTSQYKSLYRFYDAEYLNRLAEIDSKAIDTVIEVIGDKGLLAPQSSGDNRL